MLVEVFCYVFGFTNQANIEIFRCWARSTAIPNSIYLELHSYGRRYRRGKEGFRSLIKSIRYERHKLRLRNLHVQVRNRIKQTVNIQCKKWPFQHFLFVARLIRDASLSQLMAKESEVVREIHSLDSDMQTLVYENYNKFISATDTINKMRVDFRETVSRSYYVFRLRIRLLPFFLVCPEFWV